MANGQIYKLLGQINSDLNACKIAYGSFQPKNDVAKKITIDFAPNLILFTAHTSKHSNQYFSSGIYSVFYLNELGNVIGDTAYISKPTFESDGFTYKTTWQEGERYVEYMALKINGLPKSVDRPKFLG